jgi:hypothetical protein
VRRSDVESIDSLRPVVLVVDLGHDDLGRTGQRGCGRRAGTAVVDDRCHPFEQRLQVDLADDQAVRLAVHQ